MPIANTLRPYARAVLPLLAASALSTAGAARAADPSDQFTLHFAPPDGTRLTQTVRQAVEKSATGQPTHLDVTEMKVSGTFHKADQGYRYSTRTESYTFSRDGKVTANPIAETIARASLDYTLDADGKALAIDGMAGLDAKAKSALAPELSEQAAPVLAQLSEAALVSREKEEWNARYGDYARRSFTVGMASDAKASFTLQNGEQVEYWIRTAVPSRTSCGAGSCVRIDFTYESDPETLANWPDHPIIEGTKRAAAPNPAGGAPLAPARLTGSASRVLDPATMRIYAERFERTVTFSTPGQPPIEFKRHEVRTYQYSYD